MGFVDFIFSILLLIAGLYILYFLGGILYKQIRVVFKISSSTNRINKLASQVKRVDAFIASGDLAHAISVLEGAFVVDNVSSKQLLVAIREHHQNILSRCLVIAQEQRKRIDNIAQIEKFLVTHIEIQYSLLKATESLQSLSKRRCCENKQLPTWSTKEFEQKISDLKKNFATNRSNLKTELKALFTKLKSQNMDGSIVYH